MKYSNKTQNIPFKHTESWYKSKMLELNRYSRKVKGEITFHSVDEFAIAWEKTRGNTKTADIKYVIKHSQDRYVHKKMLEMEKEYNENATLKEIQSMTTREFADRHSIDIQKMYEQRRADGDTPSEAKKFISHYWFGSN